MEDFNPFTLKGKTILVTGASSGIGKCVAIFCSKMGADVILTGRNQERLNETFGMLAPGKHEIKVCDLTICEEVTVMVSELPLLNGVVHCAGIGQRIPCKLLKRDNIDSLMDVNFTAPVMVQTELLKQKRISKEASIVFIASVAVWIPSIGNAVYSATKGALVSYAKCLGIELAPRKIRVNCISPAMVRTELILRDGLDDMQLEEDESKYPLKRYGKPEDVANLAVYMLSEASSWMTCNNVPISGGLI